MIKKYVRNWKELRSYLDSPESPSVENLVETPAYEPTNGVSRNTRISTTVLIKNSSRQLYSCKKYCKSSCKKELTDICGLREFVRKYPDYRRYIGS